MKGIILAGGLGTRLHPLTLVTNKHLLPVYDRPMIHYPIQCLVAAGITDVLIVTGGHHAGDLVRVVGTGRHLGLTRLTYAYQQREAGIADALSLAEDFARGHKVCVVLGDNLIGGTIAQSAQRFQRQPDGARVLLARTDDPSRFGVARFDGDRLVEIVEKPDDPPSPFAVTGIYFYHDDVFGICRSLRPSTRGELEITDVNNEYLRRGLLRHDTLTGWWADAGTFDSLHDAGMLVRTRGANGLPPPRAARTTPAPDLPRLAGA